MIVDPSDHETVIAMAPLEGMRYPPNLALITAHVLSLPQENIAKVLPDRLRRIRGPAVGELGVEISVAATRIRSNNKGISVRATRGGIALQQYPAHFVDGRHHGSLLLPCNTWWKGFAEITKILFRGALHGAAVKPNPT